MLRQSSSAKYPPLDIVEFDKCPAKTRRGSSGDTVFGQTAYDHCVIVGEVARAILERFSNVHRDSLFAPGAELAAAAHDIGKVSPYFYEKIRRAVGNGSPAFSQINPELERQWGGHAGVSQVAAAAMDAPRYVPEILGQHHGYSPPVATLRAEDDVLGGPTWQAERMKLVETLKRHFNCDWPEPQSVEHARLIAGLTTVADWIGSSSVFEDPAEDWRTKIDQALDDCGWVNPTYRDSLDFSDVFGFSPYASQQQLIESVSAPGVYILEAQMGSGKTEAALYAAYQLLCRGQARGIYFALPTQLTSNKLHERFNQFLKNILGEEAHQNPLLLHSNAWLVDTNWGEEGMPGRAWFNQSKRGLLAPFAVGTVDQALMAAMNVKHGFVRAFGLAGKVVVLDEVHTYDAYTSTLLDALVKLLRSIDCTVIILSATLSRERREAILEQSCVDNSYPLISACARNHSIAETPVAPTGEKRYKLEFQSDPDALECALTKASQGQQILWIENTVVDAQERYLLLSARAAELGVQVGLLHSRYTAIDRQVIEEYWVNLFGKPGWDARGQQGRILVGTQVLEQSLDIDADYLVTRFAPSDMLLQRIGRLWRHEDAPRHADATPTVCVLAPQVDYAKKETYKAFKRSAFVYSPYVLCRSLEVWRSISNISLPADIRSIIDRTYQQRDECDALERMLYEMLNGNRFHKGTESLSSLARVALTDGAKTLPESKAQTRYSEVDNHDVLIVRECVANKEEQSTQLTLLDDTTIEIPWQKAQFSRAQWRQITARLLQEVVSVRPQDAPKALTINTLKKLRLHHCFYLGDPSYDEAILRLAIVDRSGVLGGLYNASVHQSAQLSYHSNLGYRVIKESV